MSLALELCGVSKCFIVGSADCFGRVHALRDVDVELHPGEAVALVGAPGAGKSTLLLCAAGLLRADAGEIRRFGNADRESAITRASYHFSRSFPPPARVTRARRSPHLHLVDGLDAPRVLTEPRSRRWMLARCAAGDAVLVAVHSAAQVGEAVSRVITLRNGRIHRDSAPSVTRVAELVRGAPGGRGCRWGRDHVVE